MIIFATQLFNARLGEWQDASLSSRRVDAEARAVQWARFDKIARVVERKLPGLRG